MSATKSLVKQAYCQGWPVFPDEIERYIFLLAVSTGCEPVPALHCYRYLLVAKRVRYW